VKGRNGSSPAIFLSEFIMEKFVFVVSKFDTLDMRMGVVSNHFNTKEEAEQYWWETVQKNLDLVQKGYNYYVESLRVA
jgi:hypothetical protein